MLSLLDYLLFFEHLLLSYHLQSCGFGFIVMGNDLIIFKQKIQNETIHIIANTTRLIEDFCMEQDLIDVKKLLEVD